MGGQGSHSCDRKSCEKFSVSPEMAVFFMMKESLFAAKAVFTIIVHTPFSNRAVQSMTEMAPSFSNGGSLMIRNNPLTAKGQLFIIG